MDDEFIRQIHAELFESTAQAFEILTVAIAKQTDATRLTEDLHALIQARESNGNLSPAGKRLALRTASAAEAEGAFQNRDRH